MLHKRMRMVRSLLTHNNGFGMRHLEESHPPYHWKSTALPHLSGKRSPRKLWPLLPQWSPAHPHLPQRTSKQTTCKTDLSVSLSPSNKVSPSWYLLQKGVKGVSALDFAPGTKQNNPHNCTQGKTSIKTWAFGKLNCIKSET